MQMIHRLRRNFILLASAAVFLLVFIVLLLVNVSNYVQTMDDIDSDLHYIASHGGVIPVKTAPAERGSARANGETIRMNFRIRRGFSAFLPTKRETLKMSTQKIQPPSVMSKL